MGAGESSSKPTEEPKADPKAEPKVEPTKEEPKVEPKAKPKKEPKTEAAKSKAEPKSKTGKKAPPSKPAEEPKAGKGKSKGDKVEKDRGTRLCIRNLVESMTQDKFKSLFDSFGAIQGVQLKTNQEGKCRGFGFITFSSPEEANKAIAEMHDKDVEGKPLNVVIAGHQESNKKEAEKGDGAKGDKAKGKGKTSGKGKTDSKGKGKGDKDSPAARKSSTASMTQMQQMQQMAQMQQVAQMQQAQQVAQQMQQVAAVQYAYNANAYMQARRLSDAYNYAYAASAMPSYNYQTSYPEASDAATSAATSKEYVGTLKFFSIKNAYGFVQCDETKALFGRDVHVQGDILPAKEVGTKLRFTVGKNHKGHPNVQKCSLA
mmetsp:Transcript_83461/g.131868  ORF Transcript_83461/g.131868 Transcript_83461/m.131868 type:complete len:373 (+) Transcript_83461:46-1164(+)